MKVGASTSIFALKKYYGLGLLFKGWNWVGPIFCGIRGLAVLIASFARAESRFLFWVYCRLCTYLMTQGISSSDLTVTSWVWGYDLTSFQKEKGLSWSDQVMNKIKLLQNGFIVKALTGFQL